MTLHAWNEGKELVWDVTVVDTLTPSHVRSTAAEVGTAALKAEREKSEKYTYIV